MIEKIYKCKIKNFYNISEHFKSLGYKWFQSQDKCIVDYDLESKIVIYILLYSDKDLVFTDKLSLISHFHNIIDYERIMKFKQLNS